MLRAFLPVLFLLITGSAPAAAQDGPHVLWEGTTARVLDVGAGGEVAERRLKAPFTLALPGMADKGLRLTGKAYAPAAGRLPAPGRILAVSDIHGRFDTLLALLKAQKVVDEKLRWTYGKGHLVIDGDVFDRGPQVTEALWFLRALEDGARKAGGSVHMVLGNHEAMVLGGDLRYLHPKYQRAPSGFPPQPELYGPASELGRWLRSRPALLKLGPFLFLHGGPSPALLQPDFDLEGTNTAIRAALGKGPWNVEGREAFLLGEEGPLWYRGLVTGASRQDASLEHVERALLVFGVKAIVISHTTVDRIRVFYGGRVYAIDAGIKDGKPGEAWIWEKGRIWRGTADGRMEALVPETASWRPLPDTCDPGGPPSRSTMKAGCP